MSKLAQRLLIFFIGMPIVLGIVFIDFYNHLPLNILLCLCSVIGSIELYNMFKQKTQLPPKALIVILSGIIPAICYGLCFVKSDSNQIYNLVNSYTSWVFLCGSMILMATEVFSNKTFEASITRLTSSVFIIFYTGFLCSFITKISLLKNSTIFLFLFLFTVFITDSIAWLLGVLLGKNNRGVFAVSPNKSVAGFIGAFVGAIAAVLLSMFVLQKTDNYKEVLGTNYLNGIILAIFCAIAGITGDLIESAFKRSSGIKDSGNIIPGRGGILDSIDSILFTAPVFYVVLHFLFHPELLAK